MVDTDVKWADDDTLARLTPDKYWTIRTSQVEGMFIATQLMATYYKDNASGSEDVVVGVMEDGTVTYWFRKTKLPVDKLAAITGHTIEGLEKAKVIRLKAPQNPKLPKPTVTGWGTA